MRTWRIGTLARETGVTVRALRYYDSVGLVQPTVRTSGGHRIYRTEDVERLYAVLVLRRLGMSTAAIAAELGDGATDLRAIALRQRAELDAELVALGALRQRVEQIAGLGCGSDPGASPTTEIRVMQQLAARPFVVRHALALLPYPQLEEAQSRLVEMFGFEAGDLDRDPDGRAVHASVLTGTGLVHLHPPTDRLAAPGADGTASAIVVATVPDVDAHAAHAAAHGAVIVYGPADMSYGVREYGARDHVGHPWSFQSPSSLGPSSLGPSSLGPSSLGPSSTTIQRGQ